MKKLNRSCVLLCICVFAFPALAQTGSSGETPAVLQGEAKYVMPVAVADAQIAGKVLVGLHVDEKGKVTRAAALSGPSWPCGGKTPSKEIEALYSTLAEMGKGLMFLPATKNGKPIEVDIGLTLELKNPKTPKPVLEIDPVTGKPKPRTVNGGVLNGKAKFLPKPGYPDEAKSSRASGAVSIQILINEEGNVIQAGAVSGNALLQFAAREAACGSKFGPTLLAGTPIRVSGILTYNFVP